MQNVIILIILAVILIFAIRASLKHFKGEGGCCGGGASYKAKPRKLENIKGTKTLKVEGMMCQNCVNHVTEAVHNVPGTSAKVNLKKGTVAVSYDRDIDWDAVTANITNAGYEVK